MTLPRKKYYQLKMVDCRGEILTIHVLATGYSQAVRLAQFISRDEQENYLRLIGQYAFLREEFYIVHKAYITREDT